MNRRQFCAATLTGITLAPSGTTRLLAQTPSGDSGDPMAGDDPMVAAEYLSSLETTGYYPTLYALYGYIHPDAEAVSPRGTVLGWYIEDFIPLGPRPAIATGVTYLDTWTWEVTGQTYQNVAEVSYTQEFASAETVHDVVRLIFHDGSWRWWFGRDAAWVEEQNERFNQKNQVAPTGVAPFGLDALDSIDESILEKLPETILDEEFQTEYQLTQSAGSWYPVDIRQATDMFRYDAINPPSEFDLGILYYGQFERHEGDDGDALSLITDTLINQPPTELLAWNPSPESGPAFVSTTTPGVDVVGQSWSLVLVSKARYLEIRMYSEAALEAIGQALANG